MGSLRWVKTGLFFLDEIGDMPVEMQAKLLTVLEDKEIRRPGAEQTVKIDVRFLAATNRQPETLLQEQTLRNDLYYRLAMNRIDLPPLREHPEDIPALIGATLAEFNEKHTTALTLHPELIEHVQALPFPGNIRELKNVVWQIASESGQTTGKITLQMLPPELMPTIHSSRAIPSQTALPPRVVETGTEEAQHWQTFCEEHQGDVYAMADALGVHRTTVIRKLKKYGLPYARKPRVQRASPKTVAPS